MKNKYQRAVLILITLAILLLLLLNRSIKTSPAPAKTEPAKVESITGNELNRVTLTEKAAQRLDIKTVPVREEMATRSGNLQTVVPYSSVIYGLNGETWVYVSPKPLVFVRQAITIEYIEGDIAVLSEGPAPDTMVVKVGVAELYGIDTGIGK